MCLKHTQETCRIAILDGGLPADCFGEIVRFTDSAIKLKQLARDVESSHRLGQIQRRRASEERRRKMVDCVVYYVRLTGGRIKIGWTSNLEQRLAAYRSRPEDLLATEPGDNVTEHERHKQFAHLRIGRSEDFHEAPDLLAHIASLEAAA
jgi:hypothetical protein